MKKILVMILALAMIISIQPASAFASGNFTVSIESKGAKPGDELTLNVDLSNNPGIAAVSGTISFDKDALELVSVEAGDGVGGTFDAESAASDGMFSWASTTSFTANSTLMKLNFRVLSAAADGSYPVSIVMDPDWDGIYNLDEESLTATFENGVITVSSGAAPTTPVTQKLTVAVESKEAKPGDELTLNLALSNNPGIAAMSGTISFDKDALELVSVEAGDGVGGTLDAESAASDGMFSWVSDTNFTDDSTLMKLNFKVLSAAADGNYPVSIVMDPDWDGIFNLDEEAIDATLENGMITVKKSTSTITYTVTYFLNGGTGNIKSQTKNHGEPLTLSSTAPTCDGYRFLGWATTEMPDYPRYNPGDTYSEDEDVALYAVWEQIPDENTPMFVVSDNGGVAGSTAVVTVSVDNNPGIAALELGLVYDTGLFTLTKISGEGLSGSWYSGGKITWASDGGDRTFNGIILRLEFEVDENAPLGRYPVGLSYSSGDICNDELQKVSFAAVSGGITVNDHTPGDINGDDSVGPKDLVALMRYCAEDPTVTCDPFALDINNDGEVNTIDFITLMKYIAGGDIKIY